LRSHRWVDASATFFITKSLHPKKPILNPEARDVAYYIQQNPVVKGLVDSPEQWDASNASYRDVVTDPWTLIYD